MATTFTVDNHVKPSTVVGNMRTIVGLATFTDGGAASSVASGLEVIYGGSISAINAASTGGGFVKNSNVDGDFNISSAASGSTYEVVLFGK